MKRTPLTDGQLIVWIVVTATGTILWIGFLTWLAVRLLRWVF